MMEKSWVIPLGLVLTIIGGVVWMTMHYDEGLSSMAQAIGEIRAKQSETVQRLDREEQDRHAFESEMRQGAQTQAVQLGQAVTDLKLLRGELHR